MLTPRGWWFLILTLTVGTIGGVMALRGSPSLFIVSLTLVIWFGGEWALFFARARVTARRVTVRRTVRDEQGPVTTLWVGRTYDVELAVGLPRGRLPWVMVNDRPPGGAEFTDGRSQVQGVLGPKDELTMAGRVRGRRIGMARFEGARVRIADLQGFFYHERFVRSPVELPVLPALAENALTRRADKRFNLLPPPGVHRHRRPGTGSELLELRDYRPGDPPRRIAWKVSARRETLVTREYESEVPIRCTLILDASAATCAGPAGDTPLTGLCEIAATVAESAIANRDLVGLAVCDEDGFTDLAAARSSTHLVAILERLARAAPLQPVVPTETSGPLISRAFALASDLYPELMDPAANRFPAWLAWLNPPPVYRRRGGRMVSSIRLRWRQVLSGAARRRYARRKRLAALIAAKYALPPGSVGLLLEDDPACAEWLQRLLAEHRVPYDVPVTRADESSPAAQARALIRAVGRGRDNELFVLMGDYAGRVGRLDELLRAVRVARARHHQVLVLQTGQPPSEIGPRPAAELAEELLTYAATAGTERAWRQTRRSFGRLGAHVLPAGAGDPAALILHRIEQLRALQGAGRR